MAPREIPDPEVTLKRPRRRTFTAKYKLKILQQADACTAPGAIAALLRREGLYSSHLVEWRRRRDEVALAAMNRKTGRPPKLSPEGQRVLALEKDKLRLEKQVRRLELMVEFQKKTSELLGISLELEKD